MLMIWHYPDMVCLVSIDRALSHDTCSQWRTALLILLGDCVEAMRNILQGWRKSRESRHRTHTTHLHWAQCQLLHQGWTRLHKSVILTEPIRINSTQTSQSTSCSTFLVFGWMGWWGWMSDLFWECTDGWLGGQVDGRMDGGIYGNWCVD